MSAFPYPAPAPAYPSAASADPTAVMGRRTAAWVIDFLIFVLIGFFLGPTPLSPLAEYVDTDENPGVTCQIIEDANDNSTCVEWFDDRLYFTEGADALVQFLVLWVAAPLLYAALQGATGKSPGKAVFGIKVVDEQGANAGFGKSLARTALWIVDLAPWCIPGLVGFITGLTTKGHRRVGDMAAKTFVVGRAHTGPVVIPGLATAATAGYGAGQPWGTPPPGAAGAPAGWGAPPPGAPGAWGAPPSGGYAAPGPTVGPAGPGPTTGEHRPAPPTGWAETGGASPAPQAGRPSPPGASGIPPTPGPAEPEAEPERPRPTDAPPGGADTGAAPEQPGATTPTPSEQPAATTPTPGTAAGAPGTPADTGAAPQAAPTGYNPQWDAARGTYIVWEPNRGKWLGWDEAAQEWKPL